MDDQETTNYQCVASGNDDNDEDEFFGNQDDDNDDTCAIRGEFGSLGHHENLAKNEELKTIGYLESYDETKELLLQKGFEMGYREAYNLSKSLGEKFGNMIAQVELLGNPDGVSSDTTTAKEVSRRLYEFLTQFQNRPMDAEFNGKDSIELLHQELFCSKNEY